MFAAKNVLMTGSRQPPRYVSTGTLGVNTVGAITSLSWTDTVPTCDLAIIWAMDGPLNGTFPFTPDPGTSGCTAKVGTVSMTKSSAIECGWSSNGFAGFYYDIVCFTLFNPPTGSQTLKVADASANEIGYCQAVYYNNVGSLGTPVTYSNPSTDGTTTPPGSTSMSMNATSTSGSTLYANAFGCVNQNVGDHVGTYNQTLRSTLAGAGTGDSSDAEMLFGDALGNGGTLTFSAAANAATFGNGGIILPLIPH